MSKKIYIYHYENKIRTLGPGLRFGLWLQGCQHACKGCIVPDSHPLDKNGKWFTIDEIITKIKEVDGLRGVTISGGEPFLQDKALLELVKEITKLKLDIICYSGFKIEFLLKKSIFSKEVLKYIDILIDGKYVEKLNTNSYLRGSDNQRIIHIKNTYKHHEKFMNELKNRNIELFFRDSGQIFIAGIPKNDDDTDEQLKKILK